MFEVISNSLTSAFSHTGISEPQLIANLVWHLPRALNAYKISNRYSVESGAVFVHGQPFVECSDFPVHPPSSVEIGDLLLIKTLKKRGLPTERSALLLQAKKFHSFPVSPDNENQLHLYNGWPTFKYVRSGPLTGKRRHPTGLDLYNGAKYLLISETPDLMPHGICPLCFYGLTHSSCSHQTAQASKPKLSNYTCFALELLNFIIGNAGKKFVTPPPKKTRGWDRVIQDLVSSTSYKTSVFIQKASSGVSKSRGISCFISGQFVAGSTLMIRMPSDLELVGDADEPPRVPENWPDENSDHEGISIIEFIVNQGD